MLGGEVHLNPSPQRLTPHDKDGALREIRKHMPDLTLAAYQFSATRREENRNKN